jgi:hypothetical protein
MKCIGCRTKFVKRLLNKAALNMRIVYGCYTKLQLKIPWQRKGREGQRQVLGITSAILSTLFDDLDRERERGGAGVKNLWKPPTILLFQSVTC